MSTDNRRFSVSSKSLDWSDGVKIISIPLFIYVSIQHGLFQAGIGEFTQLFHLADSVLYSTLFPTLYFAFGAEVVRLYKAGRSDKVVYLVDQIFYLYVLWALIQGVLEIGLAQIRQSEITLTGLMLLPLQPAGHFSFLYTLGFGLLILHWIQQRKLMLSWRRWVLLAAAVTLYFSQGILRNFWLLNELSVYAPYLVLGALGEGIISRFGDRPPWYVLPTSLAFLLAQYLFHEVVGLESYTASVYAFTLSIVSVAWLVSLGKALVYWAGNGSCRLVFGCMSIFMLPVFAMHLIPGYGTRIIFSEFWGMQNLGFHLVVDCLMALLPPLLICWVAYQWKGGFLLFPPTNFRASIWWHRVRMAMLSRPKLGVILASGVSAVLAVIVAIFLLSELKLNRQFLIPSGAHYADVQISSDPATIDEGRRLSRVLGCYFGCHGIDLSGGTEFSVTNYGTVYTANLTGITGRYSPLELESMVRFGLRPDSRPLSPAMPSRSYYFLSKQEFEQILSFLGTVAPIIRSLPDPKHSLADRFGYLTAPPEFAAEAITSSSALPRAGSEGERLARMACSECHGAQLLGTDIAPALIVVRAYSADQFQELMKTGVGLGGRSLGLMTQTARLRFSFLTDDEITKIYQYLSSVDAAALSVSGD